MRGRGRVQRLVQVSAGSSLLVVGCRRAGALVPVRGSVGRALVGRSRCPVALVR